MATRPPNGIASPCLFAHLLLTRCTPRSSMRSYTSTLPRIPCTTHALDASVHSLRVARLVAVACAGIHEGNHERNEAHVRHPAIAFAGMLQTCICRAWRYEGSCCRMYSCATLSTHSVCDTDMGCKYALVARGMRSRGCMYDHKGNHEQDNPHARHHAIDRACCTHASEGRGTIKVTLVLH